LSSSGRFPLRCAAISVVDHVSAGGREIGQGSQDPVSTRRGVNLSAALELLQGEAELAEDLVKEGRSNLSAAVDGDRHGPAIGVPPLVTAGLST
jgi:hypothetical protein